ncbi:MAG: PD-(D/E)XK nuclease family protein, partial [Gammaproteobacteria bacterium]|nr:PD-(D/E)XK nuclease family protein [Gammaproteobacteria bacterium]
ELQGRTDRVDRSNDKLAIIDYKTGTAPGKGKIINGEDIQLLSYASMIKDSDTIVYLKIDRSDTKTAAMIDAEDLKILKNKNIVRLQQIVKDIHNNKFLTAWGDSQTCDYCDSQGLCRKQFWENT